MTGRAHIIMDNLIAEKKARADGRRDAGWPAAAAASASVRAGMSPGIKAARGNITPGAGRGRRARRTRWTGRGAAGARKDHRPDRRRCRPFAQDFLGDLMTDNPEDLPRPSTRPDDWAICRAVGRRRRHRQHRLQPARAVPLRRDYERRRRGRTWRRRKSEAVRQQRRGGEVSGSCCG